MLGYIIVPISAFAGQPRKCCDKPQAWHIGCYFEHVPASKSRIERLQPLISPRASGSCWGNLESIRATGMWHHIIFAFWRYTTWNAPDIHPPNPVHTSLKSTIRSSQPPRYQTSFTSAAWMFPGPSIHASLILRIQRSPMSRNGIESWSYFFQGAQYAFWDPLKENHNEGQLHFYRLIRLSEAVQLRLRSPLTLTIDLCLKTSPISCLWRTL